MTTLFIAGAGTDVGKTYVAAGLIRRWCAAGLRVQALKPVASGLAPLGTPGFADSDTAMLLQALDVAITPETVEACTPWRFAAPLSPDMAAAAEGRALPFAAVASWCRARLAAAAAVDVALVEGAGGVMSPIAEDGLNLDLILALDCPVILVGGTYLGALSHMLTALATLTSRGAAVRAVVLNESAGSSVGFDASVATLTRFAPGMRIIPLRRGEAVGTLDPDDAAPLRGG